MPYLDEGVELLVTANGELKMARGNTLHLWSQDRGSQKL